MIFIIFYILYIFFFTSFGQNLLEVHWIGRKSRRRNRAEERQFKCTPESWKGIPLKTHKIILVLFFFFFYLLIFRFVVFDYKIDWLLLWLLLWDQYTIWLICSCCWSCFWCCCFFWCCSSCLFVLFCKRITKILVYGTQ